MSDEPISEARLAGSVLDALWSRALEAWDDDKPHQALLEYALKNEKLPDLAGRYRSLKDDPARRERAQKRLDALVLAATQMLMTMKTPPPTKNPLWLNASAGLIIVTLLLFLAYAMMGGHLPLAVKH
jgi:hypothetical protein